MIQLTVNGRSREVDVEPEMPLLWVLRDVLDVKGPKFGCGIAQCGACTVHVNGEPVRSCSFPVSAAAGKRVLTIEGLAQGGRLHPVQQAWIEEQTPQCGFCQNGMMIKATELLESSPNPTIVQIKEAFTTSGLSPNLCRCGTYVAVIEAVQHAATIMAKGR